MVDAYNTSGIWFTIILFQHFLWISVQWHQFIHIASCPPNDLILKTSNEDGHSLNTFFSSRSLEFCIISCNALQAYVGKKDIDYYRMFPWQNAVFLEETPRFQSL